MAGPDQSPGGTRVTDCHVKTVAPHSHAQSPCPVVSDSNVSGARMVLWREVAGEGRKALLELPRQYGTGNSGAPGHIGQVVFCHHTEGLAGPCIKSR